MAFDGVAVAALKNEFNEKLLDSRIYKISQPENDELQLIIKAGKEQYRLLISANPGLPLIYLTDTNKKAPMVAPNFCMLLRKHISNGRIVEISQPSLERIIQFKIQHLNELGDINHKYLIVEMMGKHSNIIFTDTDYTIIDSIKHVTSVMSSVRTVLPGKKYFIPDTMDKLNPLEVSKEEFFSKVAKPMPLYKAIYTSFTGISPTIAQDICYRANIDSSLPANAIAQGDLNLIYLEFYQLINHINKAEFSPSLYEINDVPKEFSAFKLSTFPDANEISYDSISQLVCDYYRKKSLHSRMRQKSSDLRRIVSNALSRDQKKYIIQKKQLEDTEKKDKFKVYGDLLTTYGYSIEPGTKVFETTDFYTGKPVKITLDTTISPIDNAKKFYDKYAKLKRTATALSDIIKETENSIEYLNSIELAINIATSEEDLAEIKKELILSGYIKKSSSKKEKFTQKSKPMHFISSDGYDIYVGKNNLQNEYITFKLATGNDWWFHSKAFQGSHVIVKCGNDELPDSTFEEAARLAAHFSSAGAGDKVDVDYIQKKHVKKVAGANPGFVIYHTNYSMTIDTDISGIKKVN